MSRPVQEAGLFVHGKIHEVEHENVGVEGGHKGRNLRNGKRARPSAAASAAISSNPTGPQPRRNGNPLPPTPNTSTRNLLRDNPELAQAVSNPVSRFWQKQKIKRDYAKAARAAGQTAQGAASTAKTAAAAAKKPPKK